MLSRALNAVIPKIRFMYGHMLSLGQYNEMIAANSVDSLCSYLNEKTPYNVSNGLASGYVSHRAVLESELSRRRLLRIESCFRFFGDDAVVRDFIIGELEIKLILSAVGSVGLNTHISANVPEFVKKTAVFDVNALSAAKNINQVADVLRNTKYAVYIDEFQRGIYDNQDISGFVRLEADLSKVFFESLFSSVSDNLQGSGRKELLDFMHFRADMLNINTLFRMKKYFDCPPQTIKSLLVPFGHLFPAKIEYLADRDFAAFMRALAETPYGKYIPTDTDFIEKRTLEAVCRAAARVMRFSVEPHAVMFAFYVLSEIEIKNIVEVVEGVHYNVPSEKIKKRLCIPNQERS